MKKRFIVSLLTTLMSVSLVSCGKIEPEDEDTPKKEDKDISIIYTTDVHCGVDTNLGYAKVENYKKNLEKTNYVALVDAGDYLQGEFIGAISKGEYIVEIMNEMKYDVVTLGNHEFDYGVDVLKDRLTQYQGDVVSCNFSYIGNKENKLNMVIPYVIKEYGNRKVGFVGITTPKTLTTSDPKTFIEDGHVAYSFGADTVENFYSVVQNNIDQCKANGADYVIALSHLGSPDSFSPFSSIDVIEHTSGVTAFLDGHSHTDLPWTTKKNKDNVDTLLVDTGYKLNEFASLTISKEGTITHEFINEYETKDQHIDEFVASINAKAEEAGSKVVANIDIDLEGERNFVRTREAQIGDLIADAYRYYGESDIALVNGGGIRDSLKKGDVTYEQMMNVHPFGNYLMKKKTTGAKIRDYLEFTSMKVTDVPRENQFGAFAQVSGLKYTIDTTIPSSVATTTSGEFVSVDGPRRVTDIKVLENDTYVDLDDTKEYTIASHDFLLASGGDGANLFVNDEVIATPVLFDYEVLINYIVDVLHGQLASKYSKVDNRIIIEPAGGEEGNVITISKDMLYHAKLEDYRHPKDKEYGSEGVDKKFTIDVGNGRKIDGVILFRDCSYQFVGNTLLDVFGIDNKTYNDQPYNFNVVFFLKDMVGFSINYTTHSTIYNWIEQEIKFGSVDSDDLYTGLSTVPYEWIVEKAGGGYGARLFPGGSKARGNYFTINPETGPDTVTRYYSHEIYDDVCNVVGFNVANYETEQIGARGQLDFHINKLTFTYQNA